MKGLLISWAALLALACSAVASQPTAAEVLNKAKTAARTEHKNIFIMFDASWWGWCKRLGVFLADPEMSKLMQGSFVVVRLDVQESADKKDLENSGGEELMKGWHGQGLPFMVILDPSGKVLADSNQTGKDGSNIGYPAKPEEIQHFMKMLRAAPRLSGQDRGRIQAWLTAHAPKGS